MHALDLSLFYRIHDFAGLSQWIDWMIVFFAEYALYIIVLVVAYEILKEWRAGHMPSVVTYVLAITAACIARFGVAEAIRLFYHRPRPFVGLHVSHLLNETSYSFPSGHAIFLFALATGLLAVNRRLAYGLYALSFFVCIARIAAGVHYPSDIVGGALLGVTTSYGVFRFWKFLSRFIAIPSLVRE